MFQRNLTRNLHLILPLVLLTQAASSPAFTYANFNSTAGLNLVGSAAQNGSVLRLTPASGSQMGSAWYTQQQHVSAGFTTTFSFRFTNPTPPGADGISFNVQSQGINAISDEQGTTSGISISLNTFLYADEPSDNFVAIFRNGYADTSGRLAVYDLNSTPIRMKDGNAHNVSLTYDGSAFSMSIDATSIFNNVAVSRPRASMPPAMPSWASVPAQVSTGKIKTCSTGPSHPFPNRPLPPCSPVPWAVSFSIAHAAPKKSKAAHIHCLSAAGAI